MSYANYKKALELVETLQGYAIRGITNDKAMDELEDFLGFELSKQHYEFLKQGALEVFGYEFVENTEGKHSCSPDIFFHYKWIEKNGFVNPKNFVPILEEDEWTVFLDYYRLNSENEPTIVYGVPTVGEFIEFEHTNQDLGDFLLEMFTDISDYVKNENA